MPADYATAHGRRYLSGQVPTPAPKAKPGAAAPHSKRECAGVAMIVHQQLCVVEEAASVELDQFELLLVHGGMVYQISPIELATSFEREIINATRASISASARVS